MKFTVRLGDHEEEIEVIRQGERLRIRRGEMTTEARIVYMEGPQFVLEYEQQAGGHVRRRRLRAAGIVADDGRQLWVNGSMVPYKRVRKVEANAHAAPVGSLSASIPAVVSEILVAEGEEVRAGQKLILLESMKMILPIKAPYEGLVGAINCVEGESVQPGVPLVKLDHFPENSGVSGKINGELD